MHKTILHRPDRILLFLCVLCVSQMFSILVRSSASANGLNSTILVNTEAFSTIDDSDTAADIEMRFGQSLGEKLYFNRSASMFHLTDDLFVDNSLEVANTMSGKTLNVMQDASFANGNISITATGSFGIGATPSAARFYIKGGGSGQKFRYETGQSEYSLRIGGNFTGAADEVALTAGAAVQSHTADTTSPAWAMNFSGLSDYFSFSRGQNNGDGSAVTWTQHLRMDETGDVSIGLGSTDAKTKLEVGGTVSGSTLTFMGGSSYILGNLSIGASTPATTKLEVTGTASGTNLYATKSISGAYLYTSTTFGGAGLSNCTGTSNKLTWLSSTKQFGCETDEAGSGGAPDTGIFLDTGPAAFADNDTTELFNDATKPNIVTDATSSTVLISVHMHGTASNTANDAFLAARVVYTTDGNDPTCSSTQVGEVMIGGFTTATTHPWQVSGTFLHNPGVAGTIKYTVCSSAESTGTATDTAEDVRVSLVEFGG